MSIIKEKLLSRKKLGQKGFIGYVTAGAPTIEITARMIKVLAEEGTDVIEIGIPYSDPVADGPVIQKAADIALKNGMTIDKVFEMTKELRKSVSTPFVYLVYLNGIISYGKEKFLTKCQEAGVNGLIIPDMPLEEREELFPQMVGTGIDSISMVAPTSKDRIKAIVEGQNGFVYCVSTLGVTGGKSPFYGDIKSYLADVSAQTDLPIAVGFGIKNAEDIKNLKDQADAFIIGSGIVSVMAEHPGDEAALRAYIRPIIEECHS